MHAVQFAFSRKQIAGDCNVMLEKAPYAVKARLYLLLLGVTMTSD